MTDEGLDVIIIDDEPEICHVLSRIIKKFYSWGRIYAFSETDEAVSFAMDRSLGVGIFIIDVFLKGKSGFYLLDILEEKYPVIHEDTIMITGNASDDIVDMCVASEVNYLLEKPVKPYALQLAVRSIVAKYLKFAKKLFQDPEFAKMLPTI